MAFALESNYPNPFNPTTDLLLSPSGLSPQPTCGPSGREIGRNAAARRKEKTHNYLVGLYC